MTEKDMENTPAFEDSGGDELPPSNDHPFQYTLYSTRKDRLIVRVNYLSYVIILINLYTDIYIVETSLTTLSF